MRLPIAGLLACVLCFVSALASPALASEAEHRLVVLHRDGADVPAALRSEVDRLLLGAVSERMHSVRAYPSQVPFEDIELAAGCNARGADCMEQIAAGLDADWVLVRELERDRHGTVYLTLIAHDGALAPRRAVAPLGEASLAPVGVVPMLVERLYPSDPQLAEEHRVDARSPLRVVGWSGVAIGGGLLATGVVMGVLSQRDQRAYQDTKIEEPEDVDRATDALDRAQKRAHVANGLLISGAAATAAGATALLFSYLRPRPDARQLQVGVSPARSGVAVSLCGAWRGGL